MESTERPRGYPALEVSTGGRRINTNGDRPAVTDQYRELQENFARLQESFYEWLQTRDGAETPQRPQNLPVDWCLWTLL